MDEASRKIIGHKVKTPEEIAASDRRPSPRKKRVIMCHGTFDVVHPGHVRHLLYAKSKGDILVASLTADVHIQKANLRPFVPQDLRALNLAALEMVDYVVIDPNPTPVDPQHRHHQARFVRQGLRVSTKASTRAPPRRRRPLRPMAASCCSRLGDIVFLLLGDHRGRPAGPGHREAADPARVRRARFQRASAARSTSCTACACMWWAIPSSTATLHCAMIGGGSKTLTISVRYEDRRDYRRRRGHRRQAFEVGRRGASPSPPYWATTRWPASR